MKFTNVNMLPPERGLSVLMAEIQKEFKAFQEVALQGKMKPGDAVEFDPSTYPTPRRGEGRNMTTFRRAFRLRKMLLAFVKQHHLPFRVFTRRVEDKFIVFAVREDKHAKTRS